MQVALACSWRENSRCHVWQATVVLGPWCCWLSNTGVHLFNADALITTSRTSVDRRISQTAYPPWNKNLPIAGWRRPTRDECWNRAAAVRMQKTGLKVGFQLLYATWTRIACTRKTLKITMHAKNRISLIACVVFRVHALRISFFFWLRRKLCNRCVSVMSTTTWKLHVGLLRTDL